VARPNAAQVVLATLAGVVFALVGGICGYAGATFGHHLWSAGRCTTSSCALQETPWWVGVAGALVGVVVYVALGFLAGLPRPRSRMREEQSPPPSPGWAERVAAALGHVGLWVGLPFVAAGVMVLVGARSTPFLRRHAVAAFRLQLWQLLLVAAIPVLFYLTLGLYIVVAMVALFGGLVYAVLGAVRALSGDERAYPGDWPARARPLPVVTDPGQRERPRNGRWAWSRSSSCSRWS
jgi:hypothetical protein